LSIIAVSIGDNKVMAQEEENKTLEKEQKSTEKPVNAQENKTEKKIRQPVVIGKQQADDIEHFLPKAQIKKLLAGPNDFITLTKTSTTSNSKGVIILLPHWTQPATSSRAINFLRNTLPDHGWTTISIQPPTKPINYPSIAEKEIDRKTKNEASLKTYQGKLNQVMIAVMETVQSYPGIFIAVAEGSNSAMLVDLYQGRAELEKIPQPSAVILLSGYMLTNEDNALFAKNLANTELPILDLFLRRDHHLAINNADLRKKSADKQMKIFYRQRQLINSTTGYYPQQQLLTEINSWLKSIGW